MSKIALRIKIVDRRQQAGNPDIILLVTIAVTGFAIPVGDKCERKGVFCLIIGWQFFLKVLKPFIKPAVGADFAGMMKYLQIIVVQNQTEGDLDIGVILLKIIHFNGTIASDNTDGVENGSFAGIVLAHEDQGIFNISHPQITDRFIILDPKFFETQGSQSFP